MGFSLQEQETHISYMRDGKGALVYTSDSTQITRLDKLCKVSPDYYKCHDIIENNGEIIAKRYKITDKTLISFRSSKTSKNMTEEQRKAASERLKNSRNKN